MEWVWNLLPTVARYTFSKKWSLVDQFARYHPPIFCARIPSALFPQKMDRCSVLRITYCVCTVHSAHTVKYIHLANERARAGDGKRAIGQTGLLFGFPYAVVHYALCIVVQERTLSLYCFARGSTHPIENAGVPCTYMLNINPHYLFQSDLPLL